VSFAREFVPLDLRQRRKKEIESWTRFLYEQRPNFFLTLTFNDLSSLKAKLDPVNAPRDLIAAAAEKALRRFYNKLLRKLLGRRYYKKKDAQPLAFAFLERASLRGKPNGRQFCPQNSPHYHVHLCVPDRLVPRLTEIDIEALWKSVNPNVHRTARLKFNATDLARRNRVRYTAKQYVRGPVDYGYAILGRAG